MVESIIDNNRLLIHPIDYYLLTHKVIHRVYLKY